MVRNAFYSFHYIPDNWRASQVRNMGLIEGNKPASDNEWETIVDGGDDEIKEWIDDQLYGRSVAIILIGAVPQVASGLTTKSAKHGLIAKAFLESTSTISKIVMATNLPGEVILLAG